MAHPFETAFAGPTRMTVVPYSPATVAAVLLVQPQIGPAPCWDVGPGGYPLVPGAPLAVVPTLGTGRRAVAAAAAASFPTPMPGWW